MKTDSEYTRQAKTFAIKYGVKLSVIGDPEYKPYFSDDKESRYIFKLCLSRKGKKYTFSFGQSIQAGAEYPDLYSVLACMQKYDVYDFENFCSEFGYDTDSRKAEKIYKAVVKEWNAINRLFPESEVMEELQAIN